MNMTTCARCGRTLDSTESEYITKVRPQAGVAYATWCADCILKSPPTENER